MLLFYSFSASRFPSASTSLSNSSILFRCLSRSRLNRRSSSSSERGFTPKAPRIRAVSDGPAGVGGAGTALGCCESLPTYLILWIPSSLYAAWNSTHAIPAVMAAGTTVRRPMVRPRSRPPVAAPLTPLSRRLCLRKLHHEIFSRGALLFWISSLLSSRE